MEYSDSLVLDLEEYDFEDNEITAAEPRSKVTQANDSERSWYDICEDEHRVTETNGQSSLVDVEVCLDDDDDEDDGVNVIIDLPKREVADSEEERLQRVLSSDPYNLSTTSIKNAGSRLCNQYQQKDQDVAVTAPYVSELRLKNEINNLVAASIRSNTCRSVTLLVDNKLIIVPDHVAISDQLAARIWPPDKLYAESKLPYLELFNSLLIPNVRRNGDTYAVFSAKYNRTTCAMRPNSTETRSSKLVEAAANGFSYHAKDVLRDGKLNSPDNYDEDRNSLTALYQFCDFAAIIVQDNKVIDYAVHGVRSSIIRMLDAHRPRRVYYNARIGDPLYVFVNYKYQPFYTALKDISRPVKINRNHVNFNTMAFCERNDVFCALCCCLRDVKGFVNDADVPNTIRVPRPLKFVSWLPYDPYEKSCRSFLRSRAMTAVARHKKQVLQSKIDKIDSHEWQFTKGKSEKKMSLHKNTSNLNSLGPSYVANGQPEFVPRRIPSRFPRSAPQRYKTSRDSLRDSRRGDFRPISWYARRKRTYLYKNEI